MKDYYTIENINNNFDTFIKDIYKYIKYSKNKKYNFKIEIPIFISKYIPINTQKIENTNQKWKDLVWDTGITSKRNKRTYHKNIIIKEFDYNNIKNIMDATEQFNKNMNYFMDSHYEYNDKEEKFILNITIYTKEAYKKAFINKLHKLKRACNEETKDMYNNYISLMVLMSKYNDIENKEEITNKIGFQINDQNSTLTLKKKKIQ